MCFDAVQKLRTGIGNWCYLYRLAYTHAKKATKIVAAAATPGQKAAFPFDGMDSSFVAEAVVVSVVVSCIVDAEAGACFRVLTFLGAIVVLGASFTSG